MQVNHREAGPLDKHRIRKLSAEFEERLKHAVVDHFPFEDGETFESWVIRARNENHGRRALLAAALGKVGREISSEKAAQKRCWIVAARLEFEPRAREPCFVCGKFKSITQAHHVVPLAEQFEHGFRVADQEHEWLCPNHHVILHLWIDDDQITDARRGRRAAPTMDHVNVTEVGRLMDLVGRSGRRWPLHTAIAGRVGSDDFGALRRLATDFRHAVERCPRDRLPITFANFPHGACGDAALLLAKYLERNGHAGFVYVLGTRNGGSHAWLRRGSLIIDITADQFEDQPRSVIVDTQSSWHASFQLPPEDREHPADFERYDKATAATLANAYVAVVGHLPCASS